MRPKRSRAADITRSASSSFVASHAKNSTWVAAFFAATARAAAAPRSASRPSNAIRGAPAAANCKAAARPTPAVPPVMTTELSSSRRGVGTSGGGRTGMGAFVSVWRESVILRHGHPQHGLDGEAFRGIVDRRVDVAEFIELDQSIVRKPSLPIQFDQLRDELGCHAVALADATNAPSGNHQTVDIETGFGAERRCANHAARTANSEYIDRLAQHAGFAAGIERVVDTSTANLPHGLHRVLL